MQIRCPHCHNSNEVEEDRPLADILCSACGSSFNLVKDETVSFGSEQHDRIAHFQLVERLGTGAFGTVWKGKDLELDRFVAIKIPRQGKLSLDETEKFLKEARAAAQLKHPNIVAVHEVGRDSQTAYIVTDLIPGVTLADWLTARKPTVAASAKLCKKIAEALHSAHLAGIVHRDLKPSNILIDEQGEPHIADFGLAKRDAGEISVTIDGQVLGTPAYMSPEQAKGDSHKADARSDVYSLGVILYELLTGEKPFRGNTRMLLHQVINDYPPAPRKLNSLIPKDLETICLKCLEKEPEKRFSSSQLFADELQRFLDGKPIRSRPVNALEKTARWCRRRPAIASLLASIVLITVLAIIFISWQWKNALAARREAERQLNISLNAFRGMVQLARNEYWDSKTKRPNPLRLSEQLLLKSISGLESIVNDVSNSGLTNRDIIVARTTLGLLYQQTARLNDALSQFELAHQLVSRSYDSKSTNLQTHRDLSVSLERLVDINLDLKNDLRAQELATQCVTVRTRICELDADNPESKYELAVATGRVGESALNLNKIKEGRQKYLQVVEIIDSITKDGSAPNTNWRRQRAQARSSLGDSFFTEKRLSDALREYELAIAEFEEIWRQEPENFDKLRDLAMLHVKTGDAMLANNQPEQAYGHQQTAYEMRTKAAESFPNHLFIQRDVAVSLDNLGDIAMVRGQLKAAGDYYALALEQFSGLTKLGANNLGNHQQDLAVMNQKVGKTFRELGDYSPALPHLIKSLELQIPQLQQAVKIESQKQLAHLKMMRLHLWSADCAVESNKTADAQSYYDEAMIHADQLNQDMNRFWGVQFERIELDEVGAKLLEKKGQRPEAARLYQKALDDLKNLDTSPNPKDAKRFAGATKRLTESIRRVSQ